MGDFTQTKSYNTAVYPVLASETSGLLRRAEPLLDPARLRSRFLKGIPLRFPNGDTFSDDDLKDRINLAINEAELALGRLVFRESFKEKVAMDWSLYKAFIHINTQQGPIVSLESLRIVSSDNQVIFEVPVQWIEAANFHKNLINVIPLLAAFGATSSTGSPITVTNQGAGIAFLSIWGAAGNVTNIPAYWQVQFTAGLSNAAGELPVPVNELIGCLAAIDILSSIAPSNIFNSQSMSQDGISQSSSGQGPLLYRQRLDELMLRKDNLIKKLKAIFSSRYFVGNL